MLGFDTVADCFGFVRAGVVSLCARLIATGALFAGDEAMTDQSVGPVYGGLLLWERERNFIVFTKVNVFVVYCVLREPAAAAAWFQRFGTADAPLRWLPFSSSMS